MIMEVSVDEEDEDVVIQGSALHEHLSKLGYTDFESVCMPKRTCFEEKHYLNIDIKSTIKRIYTKFFSFYSWITQEKNISEKQLNVILNAEALLNDHFSTINSFITENNSKKITLQELIVTGAVLISSTCISMSKHKILPALFASSAICCASYIKYLRFCANRNLKNVILLQNELLIMCKEGLKILRRDHKTKLNFETCLQQFSHFLGEKLRYLQHLTETLVQFMESTSSIYYQCSLSIAKLLPPNILNEQSFTTFEDGSFGVSGEIDYQALNKIYHTYLLVQSEMLYLLAIAYNSNTWIHSYQKIPERKLAQIICILTKTLGLYKVKLSGIINSYHTCKAEPVRSKSQKRAKWQDPSVQLDLASYKLQLAYNQIFSIFKDIDDYVIQGTGVDNETADILLQRLNKAFKEIDTAKSLAEFIVLLMARSRLNNLRGNQPVVESITINQNSDLSVIIDSDPEILDEVFEEYIMEELYSKSPQEDTDEYSLEQQKLDKLLAKNFMSELKEVLIDKRKAMSERESKALQRIYKNISKDLALNPEDKINKDCQFIPAPPPMPPYYLWSTSNIKSNWSYKKMISPNYKIENANSSVQEKIDELDEQGDFIKALKHKNIVNIPSNEACENNDQSLTSLPQILLETQATQFVMRPPPAFLQEETFVGSGENSEDEIDNASDDEGNEDLTIK